MKKLTNYHEKAIAISVKIGDGAGQAAGYGNLGNVIHSLGEYEKAKEYIEKALAIRIEVGDRAATSSRLRKLRKCV